jgi:uncharacterized protein YndB with AHSA1/START domain
MTNTGALKLETPGDREVVMTRAFDAPRDLVWEALTSPELLKRWFVGPPGWSLAVCEVTLQVGGAYRYVWLGPNGSRMGMGGDYSEIRAPERIVATERFDETWYPGDSVNTLVLTERDGKTTLTQTVTYESEQARDAVLQTGMEGGVATMYDRLAEMLAAGAGL